MTTDNDDGGHGGYLHEREHITRRTTAPPQRETTGPTKSDGVSESVHGVPIHRFGKNK